MTPQEELEQKKREAEDQTAGLDIHQQATLKRLKMAKDDASLKEQDATNAIIRANKAQDKSFADYVIGKHNDYLSKVAENDQQTRKEEKKNLFGAATEFANALANLIGVGHGASNQTPKTYSQEWMQEADKRREARKTSLDNVKQRIDELKYQQDQLKTSNDIKAIQLQNAIDRQEAQNKAELLVKEENMKEANRTRQAQEEISKQQAEAELAIENAKLQNERVLKQMELDAKGDGNKTATYNYIGSDGNSYSVNIPSGKEAKSNFDNNVISAIKRDLASDEKALKEFEKSMALGDVSTEELLSRYYKKDGMDSLNKYVSGFSGTTSAPQQDVKTWSLEGASTEGNPSANGNNWSLEGGVEPAKKVAANPRRTFAEAMKAAGKVPSASRQVYSTDGLTKPLSKDMIAQFIASHPYQSDPEQEKLIQQKYANYGR